MWVAIPEISELNPVPRVDEDNRWVNATVTIGTNDKGFVRLIIDDYPLPTVVECRRSMLAHKMAENGFGSEAISAALERLR